MSQDDASAHGATNGAGNARQRRPVLERDEPRRGWGNLYAPGRVDAPGSAAAAAAQPPRVETQPGAETPRGADAEPAPSEAGVTDAATRVVRDGYRIVEENLRRGRQVAAELRGARREVQDFAARLDPQRLLGGWTQTLIDPALAEQLRGVARGLLSGLSATLPNAAASAAAASAPSPGRAQAPLPLHPQERRDYANAPARVLKLKSTGPAEWLADLELDGKVRRVQIRAVDGEL